MDRPLDESVSIMRDDWNQRAKEDAYYYVAFVNPNQAEDGFHRSAAEVIRDIEGELHRLDALGEGVARRRALEIGCGPGRLTLPLSCHFQEIYGVDISEEMIRIARERLQSVPNAHFLVNSGCDLALFEDDWFSFVYSYIVFQHIPSKEIVLNYLREIQRVLVPGGITRFQVRGTAPSQANAEDPITWKGCVLLDSEIVDFAREAGMELVGMTGEQTQYLWVTLRKRQRPSLDAVTSSSGSSTSVPQRGPGAAISLWIRNAPSGADLTTLSARISHPSSLGGELVRGAYLSPIGTGGGCQMNLILPRNLPIGAVEVALVHQGEVLGPARVINVEPAALVPRVVAVCDAKNIPMEMRSESGGLKVLIENLEDPGTIRFQLGEKTIEDVDVSPTSRVLEQFLFSFRLPGDIGDGPQTLVVRFDGRIVYQAELEVQLPMAARQSSFPDTTPLLDAVTSCSSDSTSVPQRGPGAAISLWIRNAPSDADLTRLSARINGEPVTGSYLSALTAEGGCQMNVRLPRNLPIGKVEVALVHNGEVAGPAKMITIEAVVLVPRVVSVGEERGDGIRVLIEDVEDPAAIEFRLADQAVTAVDVACTNEVVDQYSFSFRMPGEIDAGPQSLVVTCGGRIVYEAIWAQNLTHDTTTRPFKWIVDRFKPRA